LRHHLPVLARPFLLSLPAQVQQLAAAKHELQQTNRRLLDAEADYAGNQLSMGSKNQELAAQLQVCVE
jgi:hypothetical protein